MTRIESEKVTLHNTAENIFNFLNNFNNLAQVMPEQVSNWASTECECSFTINGMANIGMRIDSTTAHSSINIIANGKNPFSFNWAILLTGISLQECSVQSVFNADLNPMLKLMLEKPLTNFFNLFIAKLKVAYPLHIKE